MERRGDRRAQIGYDWSDQPAAFPDVGVVFGGEAGVVCLDAGKDSEAVKSLEGVYGVERLGAATGLPRCGSGRAHVVIPPQPRLIRSKELV